MADEFGDVLVDLLFERGDQIVDVEAAAAAGGEHVAEGFVEYGLAVAVLQTVKEEKALGADDGVVFRLFRIGRERGTRRRARRMISVRTCEPCTASRPRAAAKAGRAESGGS